MLKIKILTEGQHVSRAINSTNTLPTNVSLFHFFYILLVYLVHIHPAPETASSCFIHFTSTPTQYIQHRYKIIIINFY